MLRITVASLPDQLKSTAAAAGNDDDDDDNEKGKITIAAECRRTYEADAESDTGQAASASMIYQWRHARRLLLGF